MPLCVPGSYWRPTPGWWLTSSWVYTFILRTFNVFRVVLWAGGLLVDIITTFLFAVLWPIIRAVFRFVAAFANFMVGLLMVEIRTEFTLLPILSVILIWIFWLAWPQFGCFIEDVLYPGLATVLNLIGGTVYLVPIVINILIRTWNSFSPVIGLILRAVTEVAVNFFVNFVKIFGQINIGKIVNELVPLGTIIAQMVGEMLIAFVAIPPQAIQGFVVVIGAVITVVLESSQVIIGVTVFVLGPLFKNFFPYVMQTIRVVVWVFKELLRRSAFDQTFGIADQFFYQLGTDSGSLNWRHGEQQQHLDQMRKIVDWHDAHPVGRYQTYYQLKHLEYFGVEGPDIVGLRSARRSEPERNESSSVYTSLPPGWTETLSSEPTEPQSPPHSWTAGDSRLRDVFSQLEDHAREWSTSIHDDQTSLAEHISAQQFICNSPLCGKLGEPLPHPLHSMASHQRSARAIDREEKQQPTERWTVTAHNRLTTLVGTIHAVRKTVRDTGRAHRRRKTDGNIGAHFSRGLSESTSFQSVGHIVDHVLTRHPHPFDSALSYIPPLVTVFPFNVLFATLPLEEQQKYIGYHYSTSGYDYIHSHEIDGDDVHALFDDETSSVPRLSYVVPVDYIDDSMMEYVIHCANRTHSTRGAYSPGGESDNVQYEYNSKQAKIPKIDMLTRGCNDKPKGDLCIPEIPLQIACIISRLLALIPRKSPVQLCGYEKQCADVGFCIAPRPPFSIEILSVAANLKYWVSLCWIQNGFMIILLVFGIFLPLFRLTLVVIQSVIPFSTGVLEPIIRYYPDLLEAQDYVCILIFFYGFILLVLITILIRFCVWPFYLLLVRIRLRTFALISGIRSINAANRAYQEVDDIDQEIVGEYVDSRTQEMAEYLNRPSTVPEIAVHPLIAHSRIGTNARDRCLVDREDRVPLLGSASPEDGLPRSSLLASSSIHPNTEEAILNYSIAIRDSLDYFGPPPFIITMKHVFWFEKYFGIFIQSAHHTFSWMEQAINQHLHVHEKFHHRGALNFKYRPGLFRPPEETLRKKSQFS